MWLVDIFRGTIVDIAENSLTIEVTFGTFACTVVLKDFSLYLSVNLADQHILKN